MWTRSQSAARGAPLSDMVCLTPWLTHHSAVSRRTSHRGQRTLSAECKHSLGGVGVSQPLTTPHLWPPTDLCGMVFSRVESFLISGITLAMVALTVDTQHRVA